MSSSSPGPERNASSSSALPSAGPEIDLTDCPRFYTCDAAVCPLAVGWSGVVHLPGERVCYYLLNSGKPGAAERFADDPTFAAVSAVLPQVCRRHPIIARSVERAARTGFRGGNLVAKAGIQSDSERCDTVVTPPEGVQTPFEPAAPVANP